jgi:hypothetical protein
MAEKNVVIAIEEGIQQIRNGIRMKIKQWLK